MNRNEFHYHLPPERIAQHPLPLRDASRLMLLDRGTGSWQDRLFRELPEIVRGDELFILNDARVLPVRLFGRRAGVRSQPPGKHNRAREEFLTSSIEVLLLRRIEQDVWEALVRPGRKVRVGERILFGDGELEAEVIGREEFGMRKLRLTATGGLTEQIQALGHIPLPPYIRRPDEPEDRERYQTVYARQGVAAAAPTAGLHFTSETLDRLRARGVEIAWVTLEVGLGTFEPVRTERMEDHRIHREPYEIPEATACAMERAQKEGRPLVAVGTTVVRALEDAAEKGGAQEPARIRPGRSEAEIFILPGRPFRAVHQLLTNFHLPESSLLALVAAFTGRERILAAYGHAVESGYRFYSYGDCMLIR